MRAIWERILRVINPGPRIAIGAAVALLVVSLAIGVVSENARRAENLQQARVQAEILAGSLAAPLAFNDMGSTQDYLDALGANPAVQAAGAYDPSGRPVARYLRDGPPAPDQNTVRPPLQSNDQLILTVPVRQGTTQLGSVYIRATTENVLRRIARYVGIGLIVLMASILISVLGAAYASLADAHRRLQTETQEREKAEEALRQAQKMEAMGQLTGGVAHDFNNLLMVASSGLDLMDRTTDPARRERLKSGIRQAIDRGANLTQQLLAFARKTPMKAEVVDLAAQLRGMENVLQRSLREDIHVEIEAPDETWPVEVDPSQFEVAVLNIALNARDAMPNGGAIRIKLENVPAADGEADRVRLAISDTGVGIPPELASRIFEPFFTTKDVGKGTGLGLSQVYGFARASGGEVRAESQPGSGATLTFLLPRAQKALAKAPTPKANSSAQQRERRAHVLLVEDDDRVAELVGEMLTDLGYDVTRAATAIGALDLVHHRKGFDLMFSDMVMPGGMSGLDLARQVAHDEPSLPIVLTTGFSEAAAKAAAEGLRLLIKPYRIEALSAELSAALTDARGRTLN